MRTVIRLLFVDSADNHVPHKARPFAGPVGGVFRCGADGGFTVDEGNSAGHDSRERY